MVFTPSADAVQVLQTQVTGSVLTPDSPDYDTLRQVWHLGFEQHPALIVAAETANDIVAAVSFARRAGLGVAVKSTGHGMPYPADDQMLIVTSRMQDVRIDPEARIAEVEAGVIWKQVLDQSTPYGLAPLLGSSPHVGVVGYTLGGGIGWLARRYGLAADSVRWIELVTGEGKVLRASESENSDLFRGLLGGGGNFGVITRLAFDLYPVATIYGGEMVYPSTAAAEALRFYRHWIKTVPDELTSSMVVVKFPNMPQLPEALRGQVQVILRAVYAGSAAEGMRWMQPWLDWQHPVRSTFHEMPFAEIGTVTNDPVDPTPSYPSNEMLNDLSDEAIDVIVRYATNPASPLVFNEFRHAGGAISRVDAARNAMGNRDAQLYFTFGGFAPTPESRTAIDTYRKGYKAALQPYLHGGTYLNFLKGEEARQRIQAAYGSENYRRLLDLKAKYDPDNMFRFSYPLAAPKP